MIISSLNDCNLFRVLDDRRDSSITVTLAGSLMLMTPAVQDTLEYIKLKFPNFTEHGIQHSYRITEYIYHIMSEEMRSELSDVEIFCFIMAAFFHDMGMTLDDIEDSDKQRENHHLYAKIAVEKYCNEYLKSLMEYRRICKASYKYGKAKH